MFHDIFALPVTCLNIHKLSWISKTKLLYLFDCWSLLLNFNLLLNFSCQRIEKVNSWSYCFLNPTQNNILYFSIYFYLFNLYKADMFMDTFGNWDLLNTFEICQASRFQKTIAFTEDNPFTLSWETLHISNCTKILSHIFYFNLSNF